MIECWFWEQGCKIDYPAWVQAIGSIIAIIAATGIAFWQNREASKERKIRHEERRKSQLLFVKSLGLSLYSHLILIIEEQNDDSLHEYRVMKEWVNDLCESAKTVSFDTFSAEELNSFLIIRMRLNDVNRILAKSSPDTLDTIKETAEKFLKSTHPHLVRLDVIKPTSDPMVN